MLTLNYTYRIYPDAAQQTELLNWLETCRGLYNYALRELKDWIASRKCLVDRCSLKKEYIIPADDPFPSYSDGSFQERPKFFKSMQGKLKLLQRRAARKQQGSHNWEKAQIKVARMHHRIANRHQDFHLKTAHQLCDQAQTIFAEDLNVKGLTRGMLRNDCVDAAFGQFLSLMAWVCWKRGVYFAKVNVAQGLWGTETACQVGLSGVYDLDKWRGAGMPNCEVGKPAFHRVSVGRMSRRENLKFLPIFCQFVW
jgi:transposase